ncbi:MAG: hypothetical protein GWP91_09680 [Rhodobacterales bacterium]|nr:hypothetical protein [Rhodobacterales bacterium]
MSIQIDLVRNSKDMHDFLSVPDAIYADDKGWVAPLRQVRAKRLWSMKPEDAHTQFSLLLVRRNGEPVATCSVMRDGAHDKAKEEHVAFFGFFECEDDASTAQLLFEAAADLARSWGANVLRGPRNITRIDETGVFIEGHYQAPMMAGHAPAYYRTLIEDLGFEKHHDALAYEIETTNADGTHRELPPELQAKADAVQLENLEVRACEPWKFTRDLDLAHEVMVEGFRDVPDNTPLPRAHFRALGIGLLGFTNRHMLQIATVNGEAAGFALCFPEMNEALKAAHGDVGPGAIVNVAGSLGAIHTASFKLLGIVPKFRGTGLHALMIKHAIEGVRTAGYTRLEASLVDERNGPMRHIVETAGMNIYRRYRVYQRKI